MLYGIDSRQRDKAGFIAEKNRYAPWSGAAMSGRLDCTTDAGDITLQRETRRSTSPMGTFTAQYAGTAGAIPNLTAQNCGEELLGVPREVYERSAFIRQAGLNISANAELERRIVSLITTGDEGTSYTESSAALKKQLNRRRHNRTGEIPAAEAELNETLHQLASLQQQRADLCQIQQEQEALLARRTELNAQLAAARRQEEIRQYLALEDARNLATEAQNRADDLLHQLESDHIPVTDVIARLRGAIVNLETVRKSTDKARDLRDEALKAQLRAETAVSKSPFSGMTPAQAEKLSPALSPRPRISVLHICLAALAAAVLGGSIFAFSQSIPAAIGASGALLGLSALTLSILTSKKQRRWDAQAEELRAQRQQDLAAYSDLYQAMTTAQAEAAKASATADTLYASLSSNEQGIMLEVRRFAPSAYDIPAADAALRECAARRKTQAAAAADAQRAQMRFDLLSQQTPEIPPPSPEELTTPASTHSPQQLEAQLAALQAQLAAQTSAADRLAGQISAAGDPDTLTAQAEELQTSIRTLSAEYDAIALAMSALDSANTALQNRFSPALGRRAAEIFRELTGGRYAGVVLDRSFHMSTEPTNDTVYRDAQLLSAGAADQLYLAVRLAICEMVLPQEKCPPIVLDDALTNFDDHRCAAALEWLRKEAERRQIILFTCHSREAEFFRNDPEVTIQRLTDAAPQV